MNVDSIEEKQRLEALPYRLPSKIRELLDGFKWAIHNKNTSVVMIVDGRSGMGKTTLCNQMGRYCDPDYDLHKIHYNPSCFLNGEENKIGLSQAKRGDFILFDEAMLISSRAALSEINRMIVIAMSMIRSKNLIICFAVNSIFDIDRNLALSRADVLFNVYGDSLTDRGKVMAFFKGGDGRDRLKELYLLGKKFYDYGKPKSNFNTTFPSCFVVDEALYEIQKTRGVTEFLEGVGTKEMSYKASLVRDKLVLWVRENHPELTQNDIASIAGVTSRTIANIIARYRGQEIQGSQNEQIP